MGMRKIAAASRKEEATQPSETASAENSMPIVGKGTFIADVMKVVIKPPTAMTSSVTFLLIWGAGGFCMNDYLR